MAKNRFFERKEITGIPIQLFDAQFIKQYHRDWACELSVTVFVSNEFCKSWK